MPEPSSLRIRYDEAARRHYRDAQLLEREDRRANADHLYGIAAECALLGILKTSPTADRYFNSDGSIEGELRDHINRLWGKFCREAEQRRLGRVVARLRSHFPDRRPNRSGRPRPPINPFKGWSVDQRYLSDSIIVEEVDDSTLERHREAATVCLELLDEFAAGGRPT